MISIKKEEKASISIKKIIGICLLFILLSGVGVLAANTQVNNLKIVLSNNYEMNVVTSKTKVSEILEEKHIILLPDEKVVPGLDEEVGDFKTIIISKSSEQEELIEIAENNTDVTTDQVMKAYTQIKEKIITEQVAIPFETITKDVSNGSSENTNKVLQEGKEGLKEVTYKVKYQNEVEISRTEISSTVIQEPVNKIVQIKAKVTNRSSSERVASTNPATTSSTSLAASVAGKTPVVKNMNASAYTASTCGKSPSSSGYGRTSSGAMASSWYTIAAGKGYPIGTVMYIPYFKNKPNGGWFVVQDRGGAISNNRIDVYMSTYNECISFGRRNLECYIYQ